MPSNARTNLIVALKDVDEIIAAHVAVTGGGRGKPAMRQGAAVTRSGVVVLAAAFEAFIEDLFEEAADVVYDGWTAAQRKELFEQTTERLNNASVFKTNFLYFNLGIPWVFNGIRWKKFSNARVKEEVGRLVTSRNKVGHGERPAIRLATLRYWRNMIEMLAPRFEAHVSAEVSRVCGRPTGW